MRNARSHVSTESWVLQWTVQQAIWRSLANGTHWTLTGQRVPLIASQFKSAANGLLSDPQWVNAHSRWGNGAACSQLMGPATDTGINLNDSQAHFANGAAYERSGDVAHAIGEYSAAVQSNRTNAAALNRLGVLQARNGQIAEGVVNLRKAVCVSSPQSSYRSDLGAALKQSGDAQEAVLEYQASVAQFPYSYADHLGLAAAFRAIGDTYDAEVHEWAAAQLTPPSGGATYAPLRSALLSHWAQDTVVSDAYGG
jgi:tetratricopeptide (TPR) repeat protein